MLVEGVLVIREARFPASISLLSEDHIAAKVQELLQD